MAVAPSDFILAMLDPYKGFNTAESTKAAAAAANSATDARERALGRKQQKELALADDARSGQYLDLQKQQFQAGQDKDAQDRQGKAFMAFQAAIEGGDTEGAGIAANELRRLGVNVQEYGGGEQGAPGPAGPEAPPPAPAPGPLDAYAPPGMAGKPQTTAGLAPTTPEEDAALVEQAKRQYGNPPASARDAQTDKGLDQLQKDVALPAEGTAHAPPDPMGALAPPTVPRPGPARGPMLQQTGGRGGAVDLEGLTQEMNDPIQDHVPIDIAAQASEGNYSRGRVPAEIQAISDRHQMMQAGMVPGLSGDPAALQGGPPREIQRGSPQGTPVGSMGPRPGPARTDFIKGQEPAPAGEATPEQGLTRGYRVDFGNGRVIDIDPQAIASRQRKRVTDVFQPMVEGAATDEEKLAAMKAQDIASRLIGIVSPDDAAKIGFNFYNDQLDRGAKEKRATIVSGGGAGAGAKGYGGAPTSKAEQTRSMGIAKYVRDKIIAPESSRYNIKGIREEIAQGKDALSKANSPDGLGQFASKATLQKSLMKGALSDRDVARLETATGVYSRMQQWVNDWSGDGQVPPEVLSAIRRIVVEKNRILREREIEAAEAMENQVRIDGHLKRNATPEEVEDWAKTARESVLGPSKPTKRARGSMEKGGVGAGEKPKAKPKGAADAAARRLLRK